jgi:ketosteroid isomerase-like protein
MNDHQNAAMSGPAAADPYPLWTIRFTWAVLASDGRPTATYLHTSNETEALERAAFTVDHYDHSGDRVLVEAAIRVQGGWSVVSRSR